MILFGSFQVVPVITVISTLGWSLPLFIRWRCYIALTSVSEKPDCQPGTARDVAA